MEGGFGGEITHQDQAKVVLKNQKVLEYIDYTLGQRHQGNRCSEHLSATISIEYELFEDELAHLYELSGCAFELLFGPEEGVEETATGRAILFNKVKSEWTSHYVSIKDEKFVTVREAKKAQNICIRNYQ